MVTEEESSSPRKFEKKEEVVEPVEPMVKRQSKKDIVKMKIPLIMTVIPEVCEAKLEVTPPEPRNTHNKMSPAL